MKKLLLAAAIFAAGSGVALAHTVTTAPAAASIAQVQTNADNVKVARFGMHRHFRRHHYRHFGRG